MFWLEINVIDLKERIAANKVLIARKKDVLPVKLRLLVCRLKSGFTVKYFCTNEITENCYCERFEA